MPVTPTKAMVLAAGLGLRMRPLTDRMPKPMVPVAGKPLLDHVLDKLADAGVGEAVVNVHYLPDQIIDHVAHRSRPHIIMSDERDQVLETQFAVRFGERYVPNERVPLGRGLVGVAVKTHAPVYSPDVRRDPRYFMVNPLTRSELAVPLIYKKKVIGVLDMEHTRVNYFNEDHQRTIVTLAGQIAISIENGRLYQRVAQQ